jgi:hypothetical protein
MKNIFFALLLVSSSAFAHTNAVEAFRQHLPAFDYRGQDTLGEKCEIDLFGQTNGSVRLELFATSRAEFLVTPDMAFESTPTRFVARRPGTSDSGTVEMSLIVEGERVSIQRDFSTGRRHWVSALTCIIEDL